MRASELVKFKLYTYREFLGYNEEEAFGLAKICYYVDHKDYMNYEFYIATGSNLVLTTLSSKEVEDCVETRYGCAHEDIGTGLIKTWCKHCNVTGYNKRGLVAWDW